MSTKTIELEFKGYMLESGIIALPQESGIYGVYTCKFNKDKNTVNLKKLIYIGESDDICERVKNHELWKFWTKHLEIGEKLCFNFAIVSKLNREKAKAALVFQHQPTCNTEFKDIFPFNSTKVETLGSNGFMKDSFQVLYTQKLEMIS